MTRGALAPLALPPSQASAFALSFRALLTETDRFSLRPLPTALAVPCAFDGRSSPVVAESLSDGVWRGVSTAPGPSGFRVTNPRIVVLRVLSSRALRAVLGPARLALPAAAPTALLHCQSCATFAAKPVSMRNHLGLLYWHERVNRRFLRLQNPHTYCKTHTTLMLARYCGVSDNCGVCIRNLRVRHNVCQHETDRRGFWARARPLAHTPRSRPRNGVENAPGLAARPSVGGYG